MFVYYSGFFSVRRKLTEKENVNGNQVETETENEKYFFFNSKNKFRRIPFSNQIWSIRGVVGLITYPGLNEFQNSLFQFCQFFLDFQFLFRLSFVFGNFVRVYCR